MSIGSDVRSRSSERGADAGAVRPSLFAIARTFARISATSYGGGQMGAIRREVVRLQRWLGEDEYLELLAVAQLLPGANPTNVAVLVGGRLRGAAGAATALAAAVVPGLCILMLLAALVLDARLPGIAGALRACAAVAVGLTLANAIELTRPRIRRPVELAVAGAVAAAVLIAHLSLALTLLVFVPLALLVVRPEPRPR